MFPRDVDKQREWIYNEQVKTNELLAELIAILKPQEIEEPMKRQDLMKQIAKLENKPAGWNKWETDKMRDYLRGKTA